MTVTVTWSDDRVEIVVYRPDPKHNGVVEHGIGVSLTHEQAEDLCRAVKGGTRRPVTVL